MSEACAERLFEDVEIAVQNGQTLMLASSISGDTGRKLKRYFLRNKRKIALGGASLVVTLIVGGPVGLGVAVAGKAVSFASKRAFRYARVTKKKYNIRKFKQANGPDGSGVTVRDSSGLLVSNAEYKAILDDVRYLCQHGILTDIFNAYSELERDYDTCGRMNLPLSPLGIDSCDKAIEMWEAVARVHYRFEGVREVFELFDDLVMYSVLEASRMEEEYKAKLKTIWPAFRSKTFSTVPRRLSTEGWAVLNRAANSGDVMHTHFRSMGRQHDYSGWIRQALNGEVEMPEGGMVGDVGDVLAAPLLAQVDPRSPDALAGQLGNVTQFGLNQLSINPGDLSMGSNVAQESAIGTWFGTPGHLFGASSGPAVIAGAGQIQGAAEAVADALVEKANEKLNEWQYKNRKKVGFFKLIDQTQRERAGTLRIMAKDKLEEFVDKMESWIASQKEFMALTPAADANTIARKLLRYHKHRMQVAELSKFVYEFHEHVVSTANTMATDAEAYGENLREYITLFVSNHIGGEHTHCDSYCYNSMAKVGPWLLRKLDPSMTQTPRPGFDDVRWVPVPACPVVGKQASRELVLRLNAEANGLI